MAKSKRVLMVFILAILLLISMGIARHVQLSYGNDHVSLKQWITNKLQPQPTVVYQQQKDNSYFSDDALQGQAVIIDTNKITTFAVPSASVHKSTTQSQDSIDHLRTQNAQAAAELQRTKDLQLQRVIDDN